MPANYEIQLILTDPSTGKVIDLVGEVSEISPPPPLPKIDFTADFNSFAKDYNMLTSTDWQKLWKQGLDQGIAGVYCLEQNTDATRHDFYIRSGGPEGRNYMSVFMPKGSYGMDHRSCQIKLGKPTAPVNWSFKWRVPDPGTNLWTAGGGKWGPACQYGPIQSGPTGGIRFMPTWAGGASTLGKQDLTCSIQNQPDGGQWLQPPYYGFRPIVYNNWYNVHFRMTGAPASAKGTVRCEYWKDNDPVMDYTAVTTNQNAQAGLADVFIDWTCFFGGGEANAAPKDCYFDYADFRIWLE
jgi:hypothetical protein